MKSEKRSIIIFTIIIISMSLLFEWVFDIMMGLNDANPMIQLLLDLPVITFMVFVSLLIVHYTNRYFKYKGNVYIRLAFELFAGVVVAVIYSWVFTYFVEEAFNGILKSTYVDSVIMVALGNFFIVLLIDLLFYNKRKVKSEKHIEKRPIIIFFIIIAFMALLFEWIYDVMTGAEGGNLIIRLLLDLPIIITMAFVSLLIVHYTNKYFKYKDSIYIRVAFELLIAVFFAAIYSLSLNCFLVKAIVKDANPTYLESAIMLALGNFMIVLLLELFFYNRRQLKAENHIAVIEKERIEYLYATLKTQINPHFLFNSLNVLSSLIYEDPQRANIYTKKLSNIYRYFLSTNTRLSVMVEEEILFLQSYIYLLLIRFEDALKININGDPAIQRQIIPISIQLLIENAIKHNVASLEHPLIVDVNITTEYIEVVNNLQPRLNVEESGHGLDNLQKQYVLYDKKIDVLKTDKQYIVRIPYL